MEDKFWTFTVQFQTEKKSIIRVILDNLCFIWYLFNFKIYRTNCKKFSGKHVWCWIFEPTNQRFLHWLIRLDTDRPPTFPKLPPLCETSIIYTLPTLEFFRYTPNWQVGIFPLLKFENKLDIVGSHIHVISKHQAKCKLYVKIYSACDHS